MTNSNEVTKKQALINFLTDQESLNNEYIAHLNEELEDNNQDEYETEFGDYLVLTDEEADERAEEYILDSVWAFNAKFIIQNSDLPCEAEEMIKSFQESKCEDANETILALISDKDDFVKQAISADGRGHFMNSYDGEENEQDSYYIYRTN